MSQVSFEIPEKIFYDSTAEILNFVRKMTALELYKTRKISIGCCAELANMSEEDFIKFLGEQKVSVFYFDDLEEFISEADNA